MGFLEFMKTIFETIFMALAGRRLKKEPENTDCDREPNPLLRGLER